MGLLSPVWMTSDYRKRDRAIAAVRAMTTETELVKVALKAPDANVAAAAVEQLSGQGALRQVALEAPTSVAKRKGGEDVAVWAALKITDQGMLGSLAFDAAACDSVRCAAVRGFADLRLLRELALDPRNPETVRSAALRKLADASLAERVALDAGSGATVRCAAVELVENDAALAAIVASDAPVGVRKKALERVEDQRAVAQVALNEPDADLRMKAIERLSDQTALERIARDEIDHYRRHAAFERIEDPALRRDIAASWSSEQRAKDSYAEMLANAARTLADENARARKWEAEGRCPHCGVNLAWLSAPQDGSALYCSNCGKRVR